MGAGLILSRCRAETSAASHSHLCQLEMSLEWQCCLLWSGTESGWVSLPVFPSPDLVFRSNYVPSAQSLDTCRFIFLSQKNDFLRDNKWPCVLLHHCSCQFWRGIQNSMRQTPPSQKHTNTVDKIPWRRSLDPSRSGSSTLGWFLNFVFVLFWGGLVSESTPMHQISAAWYIVSSLTLMCVCKH